MKVKFFKDKIYRGVNKFVYYYYAAIESTVIGGKPIHNVLFSACIDDGINIHHSISRYHGKTCVEITADEFKSAVKKTLQQMFNNFKNER